VIGQGEGPAYARELVRFEVGRDVECLGNAARLGRRGSLVRIGVCRGQAGGEAAGKLAVEHRLEAAHALRGVQAATLRRAFRGARLRLDEPAELVRVGRPGAGHAPVHSSGKAKPSHHGDDR
jgi:hypothetical protein